MPSEVIVVTDTRTRTDKLWVRVEYGRPRLARKSFSAAHFDFTPYQRINEQLVEGVTLMHEQYADPAD